MQYVILAVLVLILLTLIDICIHIRRLAAKASLQISHKREHERSMDHGGYAIWAYRKGTWHLDSDRCGPGFVPGGPPRRPGAYEGEVVKKPGVPVS